MPRGKVKLAFIANLEARKASYRKRKESLLKKLEELSILCDIEACAIIYSPFNPQLEVWPKDDTAFQNVLNQFMSKSSMDQTKKMLNQESYIRKRISTTEKKINKQTMVTRDLVMDRMMSDCLGGKVSVADLNLKDLNDLESLACQKVIEIEGRMELLKSGAPSTAPPSQSQPQPQPQEVVGGSNTTNDILAEGNHVNSYVPVMENPEGSCEIQTTGLYPDWINDIILDPDFGNVPGVDMVMPFSDVPNPLGSGASSSQTQVNIFPYQSDSRERN